VTRGGRRCTGLRCQRGAPPSAPSGGAQPYVGQLNGMTSSRLRVPCHQTISCAVLPGIPSTPTGCCSVNLPWP